MKAAIYCRLSDEDKEKSGEASESIQNQKSMLTNYARERGWEIFDIYCDENFSGIDSERPEYKRLLNDAEKRKFEIILCKTQSRFSRNMEHTERYLNGLFDEWGIRFIGVVDNVDTSQKFNKKSRQINGLINEWYLEDLSENVKAVLKNKHKDGKSTRPFMPYGFKKNASDKNKTEIDEPAAKVVREIFKLFLKGISAFEIAEILNEKNIPSPQEYKRKNGEKLNLPRKNPDGKWTAQAILRTIKNPMYAGDLVHNIYSKPSYKSKKVIKNHKKLWDITKNAHPCVVSRSIFEQANGMIKKKNTSPPAICGNCGEKMRTLRKTNAKKTYIYLKCGNCGFSVNRLFAERFFSPKYKDKIEKIVIESKFAARIFFRRD